MSEIEEFYEKELRPTLLPFNLPGPSYSRLPESVKKKIEQAFVFHKIVKDGEELMRVLADESTAK